MSSLTYWKTRMGGQRDHTEKELVVRAQYGDFAAFDQLVVRYRPGAIVVARQILSCRDRAEDAVQDSFLSAYKALPQLTDPGLFGHWLGSIVRHRAMRLSQGESRRHLPLDELILSHAPSIAAVVESLDRDEMIRRAVEELSEEIRGPVELYYLQEWGVGQIAEFLGLTTTTVKWRLHVGRGKLRPMLSQRLEETDESGNRH